MSTPNAEDLVIQFENRSGDQFMITYTKGWCIYKNYGGDFVSMHNFTLLKDAEECAETLKRSI